MKADFHPIAAKPGFAEEFSKLSEDYTFIQNKIQQINRICEAYWKRRNRPGTLWNFLEVKFKSLERKATRLQNKLRPISIFESSY